MSSSTAPPSLRENLTRNATAACVQAAVDVIGANAVVTPGHAGNGSATLTVGPNVSAFRTREVAAILRPHTADEVRRIVEIFGRSAEAGSLHTYSTGRNWGLGSREPVLDGTVVLDLGGLDRIRAVDLNGGWAVLEPGVTQIDLAERLEGTERMVNVTVSAASTSIVGNALDRGVGLRNQRVDDIVGLEVVLSDGRMLHVGWWPGDEHLTPVYPYGLGPSLLHLFTQSDLGVVTAATVRLPPRPEALRVVRLNFSQGVLAAAVDEIRRWFAQGLTRGVPKIYSPAAARGYGDRADEYLAHLCVDGTAAAVDALTAIISREAARSGLFSQVSSTDAIDVDRDNHEVAKLVERSYAGNPDRNDTIFRLKVGHAAEEFDEHGGFLFMLPLVPFRGAEVEKATGILAAVSVATGIPSAATLNGLNPDLIDLVVSMKFDPRDPGQTADAHKALDLLYAAFADVGFTPYRLDIDHADWINRFSTDKPSRQLGQQIKQLIDPNSAISAGRYPPS